MRVLVVAGLDPSGEAGLLADLESLTAVGARGYAVASAVTAQGPAGTRAVAPVPVEMLLAQIDALFERRGEVPRAVKTGMIGNVELARALAERLGRRPLPRVPVVVDPVLFASSGAPLFDPGEEQAGQALAPLFSRAALATPNRPELELLTGKVIASDEAAVAAARELPCPAVLVKGGHRPGDPVDLLVRGRRVDRFPGKRRPGTARGTGCRLASAIAGLIAQGAPLEDAVARAKRIVERYLDRAARRH